MSLSVNLQGVTSLIYAWGDSDPVSETQATYHESRRGTQGIALLPQDKVVTDLSGSESFFLTVKNVSLPVYSALYILVSRLIGGIVRVCVCVCVCV